MTHILMYTFKSNIQSLTYDILVGPLQATQPRFVHRSSGQ